MIIEKAKYQGYLWFSNESKPQIIDNEFPGLSINDNENPFIVEGLLYDGNKSINIKYVDGKYIVKEYILDSFSDIEKREMSFYSHRMDGKQLMFYQYWREQRDELCDGMMVHQPAELVFIGFKE